MVIPIQILEDMLDLYQREHGIFITATNGPGSKRWSDHTDQHKLKWAFVKTVCQELAAAKDVRPGTRYVTLMTELERYKDYEWKRIL